MTALIGAVGLVLARPARLLGAEPFFMEFIAGIEERLADRGLSVLLHVVATHEAEIAAYRRWADSRLVDAVVLVNRTVEDPRPDVLRELGLPTLVVGEPAAGHPSVRTDDTPSVRETLAYVLDLGHRRVAHVTGPNTLLHSRNLAAALAEEARAAGVEPVVVEGDYSEESGAKLTALLLDRPEPPTVILYDNDLMTVAGLRTAMDLGVAVPHDLSLIAWSDSTLCRLATPPLTTVGADVHRFGELVADSVLELIDGHPVAARWSPTATLVIRETTAPPNT